MKQNQARIKNYISLLVPLILIIISLSACGDDGDYLTIYSARLQHTETEAEADLENVKVELWRSGHGFGDQLILTKYSNAQGWFEFAFFSVIGKRHYVLVHAKENKDSHCKINIRLTEGERLDEVKNCTPVDLLLKVSLSEESKMLDINKILLVVKNKQCNKDAEIVAFDYSDDFNSEFFVFPDSEYQVQFELRDAQNSILNFGDLEVIIDDQLVEIFI